MTDLVEHAPLPAAAHLLVPCEAGLSPRDVGRIMNAIALIRGVRCVFDAEVTGLPPERLAVITGEPVPETIQRRVRRKVSLAG